MTVKHENAEAAFEWLYALVAGTGVDAANGTRRVRNVGFYITNPLDCEITTPWRKWSAKYAEREWQWYLSQNRSVEELAKYAPIWNQMHNGDFIVNSNYGYQWNRNDQLSKVIKLLERDPDTRRAWISLYDGKEIDQYEYDTVCTFAIGFFIQNDLLCMEVLMRSNDVWYGFCNDQYCFAKLQQKVALRLGKSVGWYYHFAADMHLYKAQLDAYLGDK